ncbi:sensor histidine kinase [Candidatus Aenigmatarchaeota archaeon]
MDKKITDAIVAHELKTPIVPLKGFLDIMIKDPKKYGLNQKGQKYVKICLRNVERLDRLIGDILDISKLESGEMKFDMQQIDLLKIIKNIIDDFTLVAREKKIKFKFILPKSLPIVNGDLYRLQQVVSNLVDNALKFTDKGSIIIEAKIKDDYIQISVKDMGVGIRKKDIPRLFEKFYQTQQVLARRIKGTGLGLVICKEIIQFHGGKIKAYSKGLGFGSTFTFTIPIKN